MIRRDTTRFRRDARIIALSKANGLSPLTATQKRAARRTILKVLAQYRAQEPGQRRRSRMHTRYPARWRR